MCWIRMIFTPQPVGYRRPLRAPPPHAATFGYYANMVQQIEFIIHTNIQPLRQICLPKVKY